MERLARELCGSSFILLLRCVGKLHSTFPFLENFNFCAFVPVSPAFDPVCQSSCVLNNIIGSGSSFST